MADVVTRFAPSPTGLLHLGHALAAKVARDFARSRDGTFLLRHEDIDGTRVRPQFYSLIEDDLRWLGLDWDGEPLRQTARSGAYAEAFARLRERGMVYPCFCTRRQIQVELASMASAPQGPEGPLYPGTCRRLDPEAAAARIGAGESHCWRLDAAAAASEIGPLSFDDLRFGRISVDASLLGDVVLARKDIGVAYHLAVVVDDAFQEVSHVTRGEDLLPSTHVHRLLQTLLGLREPFYLHHPLVTDDHGKRLAKRDQSLALGAMRESGDSAKNILARCDAVFRAPDQ